MGWRGPQRLRVQGKGEEKVARGRRGKPGETLEYTAPGLGKPRSHVFEKKVVSDLRCYQAKATGFDPIQHPDDFGQRSFRCPEGLEQDQKGQPDTGLGRGDLGRRGWRRKGGCFQKEETSRAEDGGAHVDRIRARWKD